MKFSKRFSFYDQVRHIEVLLPDMMRFFYFEDFPIMTIHKSKGLEYEEIYFLGLEDSAFWSFNKQPEEDKSAFFVALSRAKSYLIFTYCKLRNNRSQNNRNINEIYSLLIQSSLVYVVN